MDGLPWMPQPYGDIGGWLMLLKAGLEVEKLEDDDGRTALHAAAGEGHAEAVKILKAR